MSGVTISKDDIDEIEGILHTLQSDFEMLDNGTWVPDKHSINDSLDNIERIRKLIKGPVA